MFLGSLHLNTKDNKVRLVKQLKLYYLDEILPRVNSSFSNYGYSRSYLLPSRHNGT